MPDPKHPPLLDVKLLFEMAWPQVPNLQDFFNCKICPYLYDLNIILFHNHFYICNFTAIALAASSEVPWSPTSHHWAEKTLDSMYGFHITKQKSTELADLAQHFLFSLENDVRLLHLTSKNQSFRIALLSHRWQLLYYLRVSASSQFTKVTKGRMTWASSSPTKMHWKDQLRANLESHSRVQTWNSPVSSQCPQQNLLNSPSVVSAGEWWNFGMIIAKGKSLAPSLWLLPRCHVTAKLHSLDGPMLYWQSTVCFRRSPWHLPVSPAQELRNFRLRSDMLPL